MRYFLFVIAACMLLACNEGKSYDMYNIVHKNVTKNLGSGETVDSLNILSVDTTTKQELLSGMVAYSKEELSKHQKELEKLNNVLDAIKEMGKLADPEELQELNDSAIAPIQAYVDRYDEEAGVHKHIIDSLTRIIESDKDGERRAYKITALIYCSIDGVQKKIPVTLGFGEGQNTDELPNVLLPEIAYEKWNRIHNALPE